MKKDSIKILLTGDFCPINRVEKLAINRNFIEVYNDFIDVFKESDLNIIDLECPLTLSESATNKIGPHQKAHPDCINLIKYANINAVALANNHIMDYDSEGISDTLKLCSENDVKIVGAGKTMEDAGIPLSLMLNDKKIAVLNFADNEFLSSSDNLFNCNPLDPVQNSLDIKNARQNHDFIILIIHAGNEFYELPSPRTKKLYRFLIDQGADTIVSHHTHVFSGYEIYKSKPIFYGLGNFIYDWHGKVNESWKKGFIVQLNISNQISFEIIPLKQCDDKPGIFKLNIDETREFNEKLENLNKLIANDKKLEEEFQKYCSTVFPMYNSFIEPILGPHITALKKRNLFPKLISRRKRLLLLNLARCESHREVLLNLLNKNEF